MRQSIEGPLMNWTMRQWNDAIKWSTKGDGTKFATGRELKQFYMDALARGWKYFKLCDCPKFDHVTGVCEK